MNTQNRALETANIPVLGLSLRRHSVTSSASVFIATQLIPTYTSRATFVSKSNNKTHKSTGVVVIVVVTNHTTTIIAAAAAAATTTTLVLVYFLLCLITLSEAGSASLHITLGDCSGEMFYGVVGPFAYATTTVLYVSTEEM